MGLALMEQGFKPKKSASRYHPSSTPCDPVSSQVHTEGEVTFRSKMKLVKKEGEMEARQAKSADICEAKRIYSRGKCREELSKQRDSAL